MRLNKNMYCMYCVNRVCYDCKYLLKTYVDGVIFVRSLPIVSITRRPHNHKPTEMPIPP